MLTLVERGGRSRSFETRRDYIGRKIYPYVMANMSRRSRFATDEATWYKAMGEQFPEHLTVAHRRKEYRRGAAGALTRSRGFSRSSSAG